MSTDSLPLTDRLQLQRESPFSPIWDWKVIILMTVGVLAALVFGGLSAFVVVFIDLYRDGGQVALEAAVAQPESIVVNVTPAVSLVSFSVQVSLLFLSVYLLGMVPRNISWVEFGFRRVAARWLSIGAALAIIFLFIRLTIVLAIVGVAYLILPDINATIEATEARAELLTPSDEMFVLLALIVLVSVITPIVEEMFFRGVLYRWLRNRLSFWGAAAISSVVFGLFHFNPIVFIAAAIVGFPLAWLYERTGSLWPSIILHAVTNFFAQGLLYLVA